ncbi:MAG: hypothetical protein JXD21_06045 [Candidatus Omnitrophica bacterium]|nr:hypothetical protein [Candidatus Omnitrophota bacterium]
MKVLIPDHIKNEFIDRIREILPKSDIERLVVDKKVPVFWRVLSVLAFHLPFYGFYRWVRRRSEEKTRYKFSIPGKKPAGILSDAEVFLATWVFDERMMKELIPRLPSLRWIHSTKTGVEHIVPALEKREDITLTHIGNLHSNRIAEFVIGVILSIAKNIPDHIALFRKRQWKVLPSRMTADVIVGIIGLGNIGSKIAAYAKTLRMHVMAIDNVQKTDEHVDRFFLMDGLNDFLSQADFIVLSCPLTSETKDLIGTAQLEVMRKSAWLINVARGEIVNEADLIKTLKDKEIAGACLDVCNEEPLPISYPFYRLDNVLITHHSAFAQEGVSKEIIETFLVQLSKYRSKEHETCLK